MTAVHMRLLGSALTIFLTVQFVFSPLAAKAAAVFAKPKAINSCLRIGCIWA